VANEVGVERLVGWLPEEIVLDQPTRASRLKWVIAVNRGLPTGVAVNAAACLAASVGHRVPGLLGPPGVDAAGESHPGIPWAGCAILAASTDQLADIRAKAARSPDVAVCTFATIAQSTRVYAEYLQRLAETTTDELTWHAVSVLGPRNRIDKLVGSLSLLA
jgi:hypothetical protein